MTHHAHAYTKSAPLSSDFARSFLDRQFGEPLTMYIYSKLPTYSRGPRKGLVKGVVLWTKCERGGWLRTGPSYHGTPNGRVLTPGTHNVRVAWDAGAEDHNTFSPTALASTLTHEELERAFDRFLEVVPPTSAFSPRRYG